MDTKLIDAYHHGDCFDAYKYLGCHFDAKTGTAVFRVWSTRATSIAVIGDFNNWDINANRMTKITEAGIWEVTVKGVKLYDNYKFYIENGFSYPIYKCDPFAFHRETFEGTNAKVVDIEHFNWTDADYIKNKPDPYSAPMSVYEAHIASWRRYADGNTFDYRKFADEMSEYLKELGYTHLELMGVAEYPFDGSWGYQVTGYYAPTSRYGTPEDFMYLVNKMHSCGIAVILDWVPGHFPKNGDGLYEFDGGPLYEHSDPLRMEHKEWGTRCFDYGRNEVRNFLISNAFYWLDMYHIDGLRVDAVASMLYLDYGRYEWRPNIYGGNENLEAVDFLRRLNTAVFAKYPKALMIAEESTAWGGVSRPVDMGGLGFNFKWNMGWMNDTLSYIKVDPVFRKYHHNTITFSMIYAFTENFVLPISHDEVVYGKGSLINKMPGDYDVKFASVRNFLTYMFSHPGKKLLFMGAELGQFNEWNFNKELDWNLLEYPAHADLKKFVSTLNGIYKNYPAMHQIDYDWKGFEWLVSDDYLQNILVYERRDNDDNRMVAIINFSPVPHEGYRFGAHEGEYTELLRTEIFKWGQSGAKYKTDKIASHGKDDSLCIDVPPMGAILLYSPAAKKVEAKKPEAKKAEVKAAAPEEKAAGEVTAAKKAPAKKATAAAAPKKPAEKKPAAADKPVAKKAPAKKAAGETTAAKKPAAKKTTK
ncbi:MAG: 1,4-alpha-glucan branching protein GlgB [Clostridiales bacterium]|nr:1,4-alpha-glucan branching protein GlgB [Clostridiales bacterium]